MLKPSRGVTAMIEELLRLWRCRSGATAIEYGMIASMIVVLCLGAIQAIGTGTSAMWDTVRTAIVN